MVETETVLVLGAGASTDFGFPTGQALKDKVCQQLGHTQLVRVLTNLAFETEKITEFRTALRDSGRPSVDAFLEYRKEFVDMGGIAIAAALLPQEKTSALFEDWIVKRSAPNGSKYGNWYDYLFGVLADGVPFDDFDKNKVSLITFNYERSIEHYLFTALRNSYGQSEQECGEKLRRMNILHVHGSLGPLEWQARPVGLPSVPYDSGMNSERIKRAAESIRILGADMVETPEFQTARKLIIEARRLLFLGFGFHPANLRRLVPEDVRRYLGSKTIMGTARGLDRDRKRLAEQTIDGIVLSQSDVYSLLHDEVMFGAL